VSSGEVLLEEPPGGCGTLKSCGPDALVAVRSQKWSTAA
jgi:hypothetical protein